MADQEHHDLSDERMRAIFASLDADAAEVDTEFLQQLRDKSARVAGQTSWELTTYSPEKLPMPAFLAVLVSIGATAATILWALVSSVVPAADNDTLGAALAKTARVDTLRLVVTRGEETEEVLVNCAAQQLRWNRDPGVYDIARGGMEWKINEEAKEAVPGRAGYFDPEQQSFDLLAMLDEYAPADHEQIAASKPVSVIDQSNPRTQLYRVAGGVALNSDTLEATVDATTRMVRSLSVLRPVGGELMCVYRVEVAAYNEPLNEELFVVGKHLTNDGRLGKVVDWQGMITWRAPLQQRWTPVTGPVLLRAGDWLRTDVRGANAVAITTVDGHRVTLGPGTLIECVGPSVLKLASGELKLEPGTAEGLKLLGPNDAQVQVTEPSTYRQPGAALVRLDHEPQWLQGFEGATNNESIGSLVAKVDGRDVPLTVGYHKVTVDIRDQIAHTVIEESFVNHTPGRLEGVFYFPLPQDASISGFGMWIGSELVEADIVEKQRAREIYETILRERRDPGLLEWAGGNIFKARVFPIEGHSEKRVKISYTQVLPRRGSQVRYSYGLRSELLKQNPLRELMLDVRVSSTAKLLTAYSPTHSVARVDTTEHAARVEFAAQEYVPDRDFEVVLELADNQPHVMMVPHRRGDDGYFMLMVTPPDAEGEWQREMVADGEPLNLLILADTSASMDRQAREVQAELIATLLKTLGPEDRFNVATCDVDCAWVFAESRASDESSVAVVLERLAERVSLGWTDLDRAFASALERAGPDTHVIYVGDGIVTSGDGDAVAFARRIRQMCADTDVSLHAVAVSSSFEPGVMRAIAAQGGGSTRQIAGERTAPVVAAELLGEITRPTLRDMKLEFQGLLTARVYPEQLPNLPSGTEQIVLGRYLPEERSQRGTVVLTGTYGGKPVRYETEFELPRVAEATEAEEDSSFIPRLWARMHLDALLEQGTSQAVQDEIIALSEEFHIMTPYTSLLVLETDEDRERFKVQRRFQMRDAERFFAEGRDDAQYELLVDQMREAGAWRVALRRHMLAELSTMGRAMETSPTNEIWNGRGYPASRPLSTLTGISTWGGAMGDMGKMQGLGGGLPMGGLQGPAFEGFIGGETALGYERSSEMRVDEVDTLSAFVASRGEAIGVSGVNLYSSIIENSTRGFGFGAYDFDESGFASRFSLDGKHILPMLNQPSMTSGGRGGGLGGWFGGDKALAIRPASLRSQMKYKRERYSDESGGFAAGLFPDLPYPAPDVTVQGYEPWPDEVREMVAKLTRTATVAELVGGLQIERTTENFDPRWPEMTSQTRMLELVSPTAWLIRSASIGSPTMVQWCDREQRGIYSEALLLGRQRESVAADLSKPPVGLPGFMLQSLEQFYPAYRPTMSTLDDGQVVLTLAALDEANTELVYRIDSDRNVVLSMEYRVGGDVTSTVRYDAFQEVAGAWWPGKTETMDAEGRLTSRTTDVLVSLLSDEYSAAMASQLENRRLVQFIAEPLPTLPAAKRAFRAGKADFNDQLVLVGDYVSREQWDQEWERLADAERLAKDKPGVRWIRDLLLSASRRHELYKSRLMEEAQQLPAVATDDRAVENELYLARHIVSGARGVLAANEVLELLETLKPVYARQPDFVDAMKEWKRLRVQLLFELERHQEAFAIQGEIAREYPRDVTAHIDYAAGLSREGQIEKAYEWLDRVLAETSQWHEDDIEQIRNKYIELLESEGRWDDERLYLESWVEQNPRSQFVYGEYLDALLRVDRMEERSHVIERWLSEARESDTMPEHVAVRLQAAISAGLGHSYQLDIHWLDPKWIDPLAETVRHFAIGKKNPAVVNAIMTHGEFQETEACRKLRRECWELLEENAGELSPQVIAAISHWILSRDPAIDDATWIALIERLQQRWETEGAAREQHTLGETLHGILNARFPERYRTFLRREVAQGPARYRASYVNQLFYALLDLPWTQETEDELLALVPQLGDESLPPALRLRTQIDALMRFVNGMLAKRIQTAMASIPEQEELTRTELREKQAQGVQQAREELADQLRKAMGEVDGELRDWLDIERLYLEVLSGRELERVAEDCWEYLNGHPLRVKPEATVEVWLDQNAVVARELDETLRMRYFATLVHLAARRTATVELVDRVMATIDEAIAKSDREDPAWKYVKFQLLVALDRPEELELSLNTWLREDDPLNLWRTALAFVLAEQGKIAEGIRLLETVKDAGELRPGELRALANWYLVQDRRDDYSNAMDDVYIATSEWQLQNWLWQQLQRLQNPSADAPAALDDSVLRAYHALLHKSPTPQNHIPQLRSFYQATRDFRLLKDMAGAVVGHSSQRVYPLIQSYESVFEEVREEATVDAVRDEIKRLRERAVNAVDERALDLLEVKIERRASALENQAAPHTELALAALKRAYSRPWSDGERRLMAEFLAGLGTVKDDSFAREQRRQLGELHQASEVGSTDRLFIATAWARCRWGYGDEDAALNLLESAIGEYRLAHDGKLDQEANSAVDYYVSYLESLNFHARGERMLLDELQRPYSSEQHVWYRMRLYDLYRRALTARSEVSLGKGLRLLQEVQTRLKAELQSTDNYERHQLVDRLCDLYQAAANAEIRESRDELRRFAFEQIPQVLAVQTTYYRTIVDRVAGSLKELIGPAVAVEFLVNCIEREPEWRRYTHDNVLDDSGYSIGEWRYEAAQKGDLSAAVAERLLAVVNEKLRTDLVRKQHTSRYIYSVNYSGDYFWKEKEGDFRRVAEEVYAEHNDSPSHVAHIVDYLYHGLHHFSRAIEMLLIAEREGILRQSERVTLVRYLQDQQRFGESIGVLQSLVETYPDEMEYRTRLMHAYFQTSRPEELKQLLTRTDAYFHEERRWGEGPLAALAGSTLENKLYAESAAYYEELIPLHQRTQPNRGIGNGTLSSYYANQARAYAGLGDTAKAVDAACGAIVSWGPNSENRRYAIDSLRDVLQASNDLEQYTKLLDDRVKESGLENPIVRKQLGTIHFRRMEYDQAIKQLELARLAQPDDREVHQLLVECYDKKMDGRGAITQLLASIDLTRREISLYRDLARRYRDLEQTEQAERALTSVIDALPQEAESYTALAEVREETGRWGEAIDAWRRVSELRSLEPTGLLKLAHAQLHEQRWDEAAETIRKLRETTWPARFTGVDTEIQRLEKGLDDRVK
jgi:tetratricopeptide (TPR) repeat protein